MAEVCDDGKDNDCDGKIDEGCNNGGGSNGGGPSGGGGEEDTNLPPIAIAKVNPEIGFLTELISFDGSESYDDGEIVNYTWDFNDGTKGYGEKISHIFTNTKIYKVKLTVEDDGGLNNNTIVNVTIIAPNNPPNNLKINGPTFGHQNTAYLFNVTVYDPDVNDSIIYNFKWGDGDSHISDSIKSEINYEISHDWKKYGIYEIEIYAEDESNTRSETETHTIYIDVHTIDDEIRGYLLDENSDETFDRFFNYITGNETNIQKQDDGTYLIDIDGDGNWDYIYNIDTKKLAKYEQDYTSIYLLGILALILFILFLILSKIDKDKNQKKIVKNIKKKPTKSTNKKEKTKNSTKKTSNKKKKSTKKKTVKK
jgi:PKD repeat protein